MATTRKK